AGVRPSRCRRLDRGRAAAVASARAAAVADGTRPETPHRAARRAPAPDGHAVGRAAGRHGRARLRAARPRAAGVEPGAGALRRHPLLLHDPPRLHRDRGVRAGGVRSARRAGKRPRPRRTGRRETCLDPWITP
ncbi:MAG: hypothetical protein F4018_09725, partial [Acidobacteria bacterium]|nr:hypothetical protein [Acidobacteriota bacterium]